MELTPTGKVILGILALEPKSGYEIKTFVDKSTRFFWAASYGQIYPELRNLEEAGLVKGVEAPTGGRRRTVYELTAEGEDALKSWLTAPPAVLEMRHEGMLKVFFGDAVAPEERVRQLHGMRDQHLTKLEALRAVEAGAEHRESSTYRILSFGIEFNEWIADWCDRAAREIAETPVAAQEGSS